MKLKFLYLREERGNCKLESLVEKQTGFAINLLESKKTSLCLKIK